jgi:hypothetical protein
MPSTIAVHPSTLPRNLELVLRDQCVDRAHMHVAELAGSTRNRVRAAESVVSQVFRAGILFFQDLAIDREAQPAVAREVVPWLDARLPGMHPEVSCFLVLRHLPEDFLEIVEAVDSHLLQKPLEFLRVQLISPGVCAHESVSDSLKAHRKSDE